MLVGLLILAFVAFEISKETCKHQDDNVDACREVDAPLPQFPLTWSCTKLMDTAQKGDVVEMDRLLS